MKHCGTQRIETERLILRQFSEDDADAMYRNWASDSEVVKYLTWPAHADVDVSREVLKDWVSSYIQKDYYQWAIVFKCLLPFRSKQRIPTRVTDSLIVPI